MQTSLAGLLKEIAQGAVDGEIMSCTVKKSSPLQLKFDGDSKIVLDKDVLIIPKNVTGLSKGKTVYITPTGNGEKYMVMGRG
ncbi:MAG: DUF2577 domain-containing protein [Lachnospiraceae bacterium]|nr:DUF2577 domain-containing protein [Lachnospiraceae bacterium]